VLKRLILWLALAAAWLPAAEHRGVVKAKGLPIPGAVVTARQGAQQLTASTDPSGQYYFKDLAPGAWTLEVQIFGFERARRELNPATETAPAEWNLKVAHTPALAALLAGAAAKAPVGGFQRLDVSQTAEAEATPPLTPPPAPAPPSELNQNANEAFLLSGSLSRGLAPAQQEDTFGRASQLARKAPAAEAAAGKAPAGQARPAAPAQAIGNRAGLPTSVQAGAFFALRNSALDARPYSFSGQPLARPSYAQSYYGVVAGGPLHIPKIVKSDQTFFFISYIANRGRNPFGAVGTLPVEAERAGDFSQSEVRGPLVVYDPLTRAPFPANRIPKARMHPIAAGLLPFIPLPNQPGRAQNYEFLTSVPADNDNVGLRLGRNFDKRNRVFSTFNLQNRSSQTVQLYGFRDRNEGLGYSGDITWQHTLKRGPINTLKWSFSRNSNRVFPYFASGPNVAAALGITGTSSNPLDYGPPNLSFTNFSGLTDASAARRVDQNTGVTEAFSRMKGKHTTTVGGDYRRVLVNSLNNQNGRGNLSFSGLLTSDFDAQGLPLNGTGFDLADFLLGFPQTSSVRYGSADTYYRTAVYNLFAQDDWRLRSNLTLNVGLRYEFLSPVREKYGRMANLDIAPWFTGAAVVTPGSRGPYSGEFPRGLVDPDRNNLAPRVGLAWKPFPKRSLRLRAGYGVYFNTGVYAQAAGRLAQQPPFAHAVVRNTTLGRLLTLDNVFATPQPAAAGDYIANTFAVDRGYRVGYAQTWNASLQQEFPGSLVLELGYLGTKGTRLDIQRMPNRAPAGSPLTAELRRQIPNAVGFVFDGSEGNSIYHAGQLRLTRRFSKGVSLNALYTCSKSIDNVSTFGGGVPVVAQDDTNLAAERGLSSFDRRHTLDLFYVLTSPAGQPKSRLAAGGWAARLLKDWTLSGGVTVKSGTPFTATILGNRSDVQGTGVVGGARADATGLSVHAGGSYFNSAAFTLPPAGRYGNAGRNTIPGLGLLALNASFGRAFRLNDRTRTFELRLAGTNVTNHASITRLATTVNAINYGLATGAAPMRTVSAVVRFRF
jgi:hypothetical protein